MLEGRDWAGVNGATHQVLSRLKGGAPNGLPKRYLDLLAFSDGGGGSLSIQPLYLCLDAATTVADAIESENNGQAVLQGFLIFCLNGGGEYIAFDTRDVSPWPVVTIDMVAGGSSAEAIAPDFDAFLDQIGVEAASV